MVTPSNFLISLILAQLFSFCIVNM
jgi:hypothetical protein